MPLPTHNQIATLAGATSVTRAERLQTVWSGYGELVRYHLAGGDPPSVVAKQIRPPKGSGLAHERKLRSYQVEQAFYRDHAPRCDERCRVARCLHLAREKSESLFVFEDLDASGFSRRTHHPTGRQLDACLRWLAAFHATFLGERPRGLWKVGTYWHLKTRPDELSAMPGGPLRAAAAAIDARLTRARFQTWVHGDAKPANFCFAPDASAVAAVDFQYVGGGVGVKDVAYLLAMTDQNTAQRGLETYFSALRAALSGRDVDVAAIEAEWRALYPWAWADFERFLAGWSPGWRVGPHEAALTRQVLRALSTNGR